MKKFIRIVTGSILILFLLYMPMLITQLTLIVDVTSVQQTINEQREVAYETELTAITDVIIDINKRLDLWQRVSTAFPILFTEQFKTLDRVK